MSSTKMKNVTETTTKKRKRTTNEKESPAEAELRIYQKRVGIPVPQRMQMFLDNSVDYKQYLLPNEYTAVEAAQDLHTIAHIRRVPFLSHVVLHSKLEILCRHALHASIYTGEYANRNDNSSSSKNEKCEAESAPQLPFNSPAYVFQAAIEILEKNTMADHDVGSKIDAFKSLAEGDAAAAENVAFMWSARALSLLKHDTVYNLFHNTLCNFRLTSNSIGMFLSTCTYHHLFDDLFAFRDRENCNAHTILSMACYHYRRCQQPCTSQIMSVLEACQCQALGSHILQYLASHESLFAKLIEYNFYVDDTSEKSMRNYNYNGNDNAEGLIANIRRLLVNTRVGWRLKMSRILQNQSSHALIPDLIPVVLDYLYLDDDFLY